MRLVNPWNYAEWSTGVGMVPEGKGEIAWLKGKNIGKLFGIICIICMKYKRGYWSFVIIQFSLALSFVTGDER